MLDVEQLLHSNGLFPKTSHPGRHYLICPKCSASRKRHNQKKHCLSLMIEADKAFWKCHHCGWSGPEKGSVGSFSESTRYEYPGGNYKVRKPNGYAWEHEDTDGTVRSGANGLGPALYRIEEAREAGGLIAVVEGEKDVETLWRFGIPAVTSPHGAAKTGENAKWTSDHSAQLKGLDIVVLNDNDEPGYAHAKAVVDNSIGVAKSVRRLDLALHWPGMPAGADISDFIAERANYDDFDQTLRDLLRDAPLVTYEPKLPSLPFIRPRWDDLAVPELEWSVPDRIPARQACLFSGHGGTGKSIIGLQLCAAHVLNGRDWLFSMPNPGPAFFIDAEDHINIVHRRLDAICRHYAVKYAELAEDLLLLPMAGEDAVLAAPDKNGKIEPLKFYRQLLEAASDIKPIQIVIASLADVFAGNENDRGQVRQFASLLTRIAIRTGGSVILIAHPSKSALNENGKKGGGYSGSTAWHNSFRSRIGIEGVEGDETNDLRQLSFHKNQYGPLAEDITLRWKDGLFVPEPKPGSFEQAAHDAEVDNTLITLMRKYDELKQPLSPKLTARNYLPTILERHEEAKGFKRKDFAAAMIRLLERGILKVEEWGPPSKRYSYVVLT